MKASSQKLSFREKLGYSFGDSAANLIFQTLVMFQLSFYTDTFGIAAGAAATLLVVARFWDAIFDPFMGAVADRTNTRWGKFRPWIIWTALPFGIMAFLAFSTPDLSEKGKLVYAYITYISFMMIYSANNLPYSSLSGVMTGDMVERTSLSSYRFVLAMVAQFIVQGLALPLVNYFGNGDTQKGYQYTIGAFSILAVIFFIITFATTKERIQPPPQQKPDLKKDFRDLFSNGPWIAMFFVTLFIFINLSMRGSVLVYYFKYYVDDLKMTGLLESLGLAGTKVMNDPEGTVFSLFNVLGTTAMIIGILFSKMLSKRFGKRNVFIVALSFTALFTIMFITLPPDAVGLTILMQVLLGLSYGPTIPLLWAMMGDVADYSEWKNGRRATALVFSAIVFSLKAGLGFGGAIAGWILQGFGYVANVEQTAGALHGIRMTVSIFPAISFIIAVFVLTRYKITRKLEIQIQDELDTRRQSYNYETN